MERKDSKKTLWQRFVMVIKLGWSTPTLPDNVLLFQMQPLIRVLRVLGGISTVLVLTKKSILFPPFFLYIFFLLTFAFFIYHTIISYFRITHMYRTLRSDKLDVKNSPIDRLSTIAVKVLWCIKGSCEQLPHLGLGLSIGAVTDQILENSGRKPIFMPFLGGMLNKVIGNETVDSIYTQRREAYKELLSLDKREGLLEQDKKDLDALLKSGFLSEEDKKVIAKDFWANTEELKAKRNKILKTITKELDGKDPFNTGRTKINNV